MTLVLLSVITIFFAAALESSLKFVWDSAPWRSRMVETFFALIVGFSAIASLLEHHYQELSLASGIGQLGLVTLFVAMGFFAYHTHRVIYVEGYAKGLIVHHLGLIVCIVGALISDKAYYYLLWACIPITSAAVRNFRWFYRKSQNPRSKKAAIASSSAYLVFELVPPIWALGHFFVEGIHAMKVPVMMWIGMVGPGIALALMTFYYSVLFVRRSF